MDLNPPSPANDSGLANRMDKIGVMMTNLIQCVHSLGKHSDQNDDNEDNDHNDDSQSSLNRRNMSDFYRGAHK